jgi:phage gp36-like protein
MSYASRADLERINGPEEVVQRESMLAAGGVAGILDDADKFINGYLSTRYSLPLSEIPPNLPQYAASIARYHLLGEAATERARNDYRDAITWLTAVMTGKVQLQVAVPAPGSDPSLVVMSCSSPAVFKRDGRP